MPPPPLPYHHCSHVSQPKIGHCSIQGARFLPPDDSRSTLKKDCFSLCLNNCLLMHTRPTVECGFYGNEKTKKYTRKRLSSKKFSKYISELHATLVNNHSLSALTVTFFYYLLVLPLFLSSRKQPRQERSQDVFQRNPQFSKSLFPALKSRTCASFSLFTK